MAPKRKEAPSSPQRQPKKEKRDPAAEKLKQQFNEIAGALKKANVSSEVKNMVANILPLSLGEFSEHRQRFQVQMVAAIADMLGEVEAGLSQLASDKRSERDTANEQKPVRDSEAAEALEKLNTKLAELQRIKVDLAEKASTFRVAKSALDEAEMAKVRDGQKGKDAEKKKSDCKIASENLAFLKTASPEHAEVSKRNHDLMATLKKYGFDESMLIALPAALGKAPDARGRFDLIAITQLETKIAAMIDEQDAILAEAVPGQAKCDAAIKEAQGHWIAAKDVQMKIAKAYESASKEKTSCEIASKAADKAVRDNTALLKQIEKAVTNAEVDVEVFQQGPLATFKDLQNRAIPPIPTNLEEEVAAAAPMEQVALTEINVEVPAVAVAVC